MWRKELLNTGFPLPTPAGYNVKLKEIYKLKNIIEAIVAHGHRGVTVKRRLWARSPFEEVKYLFKFNFHFFGLVSRQSAALSSATQYAMHRKIRRKVENGVS